MTSQAFPTNTTAAVVNTAIDGVFGVAVKAAQTALITALDSAEPIFAAPVLSTITEAAIDELVQFLGNEIYKNFALWVTFAIIDLQVRGEQSNVATALAALKTAQASGDESAIQAALTKFGTAVQALTHIDGSSIPPSL